MSLQNHLEFLLGPYDHDAKGDGNHIIEEWARYVTPAIACNGRHLIHPVQNVFWLL